MSHTPGPWMTHGQYVITGNPVGPINAHNPDDARLIAGAPELKAELKALLACFWEGRPKKNVRRDYHLMVQCEAAAKMLREIEGE